MKIKLFIILVVLFLFTAALAHAEGTCRSASGGYCLNLAPYNHPQGSYTGLAAVVPGLEFLKGTTGGAGDIISRLYIFGLGLVGISALIMFVFGGVIYMTAADSQSRVNQAKSMMGNAVFGLVLALISYLILFTINPDLVTKGFPVPKVITPSPTSGVNAGAGETLPPPAPPKPLPPGTPES